VKTYKSDDPFVDVNGELRKLRQVLGAMLRDYKQADDHDAPFIAYRNYAPVLATAIDLSNNLIREWKPTRKKRRSKPGPKQKFSPDLLRFMVDEWKGIISRRDGCNAKSITDSKAVRDMLGQGAKQSGRHVYSWQKNEKTFRNLLSAYSGDFEQSFHAIASSRSGAFRARESGGMSERSDVRFLELTPRSWRRSISPWFFALSCLAT